MEKTNEVLNRKKITTKDKLMVGSVIVFSLGMMWGIGCFKFPTSVVDLWGLLGLVLVTTIGHEWIHVLFFQWFGKGEAKTKVIRNRKLRALMVYQSNPNVVYTKNQTVWILLAPFLIITLVSLGLEWSMIDPWYVRTNMMINIIGSSLDLALIIKLYRDYPLYNRVAYHYVEGEGVEMHLSSH